MSGLFTGLQFKLGYEGYKSVSKPKMTKLGYEKAGVRGDVVPIRKGELYRSVAERTGYTVKGLPKERQYMKIVQLKQYRPGNKLVLVPKSNVGEYTSPIFRAKGYAYGKEGMVTGQRTVELRFFKKNRAYVYNERTGGLGEYKTIKNALGGIRQELKPLKEVPILKTGEISKVGFEYKPRYVFKPMYFSAVKPGFMTKNMARKLSVKTGINTNVKISTPTVTTIERVLPRTIQKQSIINREASRSESVLSNAVRSKNNVLRTVPSYWMPDEYVPKLYGRGAMMRDQSYYGLTYKFREFKIPSLEKILGGK